jgi:uncharacterized protein YndB with AHSA1/START domain
MTVNHTFQIDRSATTVFATLADPSRLADWQGEVEIERDRSGPLVAGERFGEVHTAMGRSLRSTVEVVEADAPRVLALRILDGPIPFDGRWTLEEEGASTSVRFEGELRGHHARLRALVEGAA